VIDFDIEAMVRKAYREGNRDKYINYPNQRGDCDRDSYSSE
jgi:hypothetical protein